MNADDAIALLRSAIPPGPGVWADLGAGDGTFTRALATILGSASRVYAIDRDARALRTLADWARVHASTITPLVADFSDADLSLPAGETLDGILLANALHYIQHPGSTLARLVRHLGAHGRVVLIEYDRRRANPWVPYPIPRAKLMNLAREAGLSPFTVTATRPSRYGGDIYVAVASHGDP